MNVAQSEAEQSKGEPIVESAEHSRNIMRAKRVSPRTANPESRQAPWRAGELANQWKDTVAVVEAESYIEHAGHKHISLFDRLDWKISSFTFMLSPTFGKFHSSGFSFVYFFRRFTDLSR